MKKFLIQSVVLLATCLSLFLLLKLGLRGIEKKTYNSAFVDKLKLLKANKANRKIVLIGGSSVGFGLSAEMIERATGIRSINLGHNVGFGLLDYQPFLLEQLNKDDIIVFSPEWDFYTNPDFQDKPYLDDLILHNPGYGEILGNRKYVIRSYFSKITVDLSMQDIAGSAYIYNCMNSNGDIVSHCDLPSKSLKTDGEIPLDSLRVDKFRKYFPYFNTNRTLIVFPPTTKRIYAKYGGRLQHVEKSLREMGFEVVDRVEDNVYDERDFFDTESHLICAARERRTLKFISFLTY